MRVTQNLDQTQFLAALQTLESGINQTQNQMSSGKPFTTASQNPTAAGAVNNYTQALAQSQQYATNANSAQTNLNTEDNALTQLQNQLQSLRDLALEANNGDPVEHGSLRHRDPGCANSEQLVVAGQYQQWQRRVHIQRLRGANPALYLKRGGRDLQWRSGPAANTNRGGPDRGRRRQRQYGFQSDQDRQWHIHGIRQRREQRIRHDRRNHGIESGGL